MHQHYSILSIKHIKPSKICNKNCTKELKDYYYNNSNKNHHNE